MAKRQPKKSRKDIKAPEKAPDVQDQDGEKPKKKKGITKHVREPMAPIAQEYMEMVDSRCVLTADDFDIFSKFRLHTGVVDLDVVLLPAVGSRICVAGDESTGKSLVSYIFEAAAHHTCRWCYTPIIDWTDPKTGEIKTTCQCGKNERMVVLRIETEDCFDPAWAAKWGVMIDDPSYEAKTGFKMSKNKQRNYWVAVPTKGDAAYRFADQAIRRGAVDLVTIDSIAMMFDEGSTAEVARMGSHAKMTITGARLLERAQTESRINLGARTTCLWTTQYYLGQTRNSRQDPRVMVGGKRMRYVHNQVIRLNSCKLERNVGVGDHGARYGDIFFEIIKQKEDTPRRKGHFRVYLDLYKTKFTVLGPGKTDEADRLLAYLTALGYFKREPDGYVCVGRKFQKVADIHRFLTAPDTNYMLRYLLLSERLSITAAEKLEENIYAYSPFGRDPLFDIANTAKERSLRSAGNVKVQAGGDQPANGADDEYIPEDESDEDEQPK